MLAYLGFGVALLAAAPQWSTLDDAQRLDAERALRALPMPTRLAAASERFLGTNYVLSPLGEGSGPDADPLLRLDAVDCVTMVEESMALSLAGDDEQVVSWLNRIRYFGVPSYGARNHVMEAQWLPNNLKSGFVKDVTRALGGASTRRVKKVLSPKTWREKSARALKLDESSQPLGTFEFDVIPASKALSALKKAPAGLIVVVVRADRPTLVTRVSHVGILVQSPNGPTLRHASRSFKQVVDEPLARYLSRNLDFASWTIEGLAIFEPLEPVDVSPASDAGARP